MSPKRNTPTEYPCVFSSKFLHDEVDPRIKKRWPKAPFGNLRRIWREQHCMTLNPYGSATCPYAQQDCALSFLQTVEHSLAVGEKPVPYFVRAAKTSALERADHKPLTRTQGPSHPGAEVTNLRKGYIRHKDGGIIPVQIADDLYRALTRPVPIRDLFGSFDFRSRQGSADDGEESTE
jgi:hypothetical protein